MEDALTLLGEQYKVRKERACKWTSLTNAPFGNSEFKIRRGAQTFAVFTDKYPESEEMKTKIRASTLSVFEVTDCAR